MPLFNHFVTRRDIRDMVCNHCVHCPWDTDYIPEFIWKILHDPNIPLDQPLPIDKQLVINLWMLQEGIGVCPEELYGNPLA